MKIFRSLIFLFICFPVFPQQAKEILPPNYIKTIDFNGGGDYLGNPVIQLGGYLHLEFDDIIGDEADYYYKIEYFNYDWTPSELNQSEYMTGFDQVRILNYKNSFNTLQPYTHYSLQIPNKDTKNLRLSGNYILSVYNSNQEVIFSRKFMIYEPITPVAVTVKRSRDLNYINEKQGVNFTVDFPDLLLRDPDKTVKVMVMQNHILKSAIYNIKPQYTVGSQLIYRYDQPTAFWAGNEYLQFDSKDIRAATYKISRIELGDLYHHFLFVDRTRDSQPYTYNPDINGQFVVRTLQGEDPAIESEYVWTHFGLLNFEPLDGGEIHIYGAFNNFQIDDSTLMTYNEESELYEGARLFKQGYYDYKYVLVRADGSINESFISGNFDKTENTYQVLIYFRDLGGRYDRIIGYGTASSLNITN